MAKKMTPPFRSQTMTHLRDARHEFSERLALDQKRVELTERRTAVLERQVEQRAAAAATRLDRTRPLSANADFTARRAEMDAILAATRMEIANQLITLCDLWQLHDKVTPAQCRSDLMKLANAIAEAP